MINFEDVFVAIYDEEDSFASYFIKKQGINRRDILNYITHGISVVDHLAIEEEYNLENEEEYEDVIRRNFWRNYIVKRMKKAQKNF